MRARIENREMIGVAELGPPSICLRGGCTAPLDFLGPWIWEERLEAAGLGSLSRQVRREKKAAASRLRGGGAESWL